MSNNNKNKFKLLIGDAITIAESKISKRTTDAMRKKLGLLSIEDNNNNINSKKGDLDVK